MQSTTDGLVTFLPHGLPFICQPAGMTGTVLIQSNLTSGINAVQLDELPSLVASSCQPDVQTIASTTAISEVEVSEEQLRVDKQSIYNHPLFPLMTQLFERCEKATQGGPGSSNLSEGFDEDILAFVHQQEQNGSPFFIDDPDVDGLMVRAIQVLRIHVLEIEKVGELCKDFCQRYIASLKQKLNSEHLLGDITEFSGLSDDEKSVICGSDLQNHTVGGLSQGQVVSGGTVYQMVQTPQGLVAQPIQLHQPILQPVSNTALLSNTSSAAASSLGALTANFDDEDENGQHKAKRGVLPKRATQIMKSWLFQHIAHPYPTEDEKRQIAAQANLSILQVNNWFINGRRRILQPMLDTSGTSSTSDSKPKAAKSISSMKSAQRFWPENIASIHTVPTSSTSVVEDSNSQPVEFGFSESVPGCDEDSNEAENSDQNNESDNGDDLDAIQRQGPSLMSASRSATLTENNVLSSRQKLTVD